MRPSSARRPCGHQPPHFTPSSRATSRAARSTPVCPPETILVNMTARLPSPRRPTMKILRAVLLGTALLSAPLASWGQAKDTKPPPDPAFAPVKDDPALPRILLIGDSISIGYTVPVRELLKGKANVHRIPTNGGPTTNGIKH